MSTGDQVHGVQGDRCIPDEQEWMEFKYKNWSRYFGKQCDLYFREIMDIYKGHVYEGTNRLLIFIAAGYYADLKESVNMFKYLYQLNSLGRSDLANSELGLYYLKMGMFDKMETCLLLAIRHEEPYAMNTLATYYKVKKINIDKIEPLYLRSIQIAPHASAALYNLALYYLDIKSDNNKFIKYMLMSIYEETNFVFKGEAINILINASSPLKLYLLTMNDPNYTNIVTILKTKTEVNNFINKTKLFTELNVVRECPICFDTKINIPFECAHLVCVECYSNLKSCPLCRAK